VSRKGLLHHVEIYVSNLERSSAFWGWFLGQLGYVEHQRWKFGISFKLGDTYLVFAQTDSPHLDVAYHRCRTGLNHLAFHAESDEHVDQMRHLLTNRGVTLLYTDKHPQTEGHGSYAVFFEDPDRIKVELVAPERQNGR